MLFINLISERNYPPGWSSINASLLTIRLFSLIALAALASASPTGDHIQEGKTAQKQVPVFNHNGKGTLDLDGSRHYMRIDVIHRNDGVEVHVGYDFDANTETNTYINHKTGIATVHFKDLNTGEQELHTGIPVLYPNGDKLVHAHPSETKQKIGGQIFGAAHLAINKLAALQHIA